MTKKQQKVVVRFYELSMGELDDAEKVSGIRSLASELQNGASMAALAAIYWAWVRRSDPTFTYEAARLVPPMSWDLIAEEPDPPTQPAEQKP